MNHQRFDTLARTLSGAPSRRYAIGGMLIAVTTALTRPGGSLAAKKVGKKCDKSKDCVDGAKCKKDKCTCKSRFTQCTKKCYDLDKDEKHCGQCGNTCNDNETCISGVCIDPLR